MKRSYDEVNWPEYFARVEQKIKRKQERRDMYQFIAFATGVTVLVCFFALWKW